MQVGKATDLSQVADASILRQSIHPPFVFCGEEVFSFESGDGVRTRGV